MHSAAPFSDSFKRDEMELHVGEAPGYSYQLKKQDTVSVMHLSYIPEDILWKDS